MELDQAFLQNMGGVGNNSFIDILEPGSNENDEIDQSTIIRHSSYYDFNKLLSLLNTSKNLFSIFSTNIQTIKAKFDELKIFVEILKRHGYAFSAIWIQETWLIENENTSQLELEGYECISQGRSCSSKGGLLIYLSEKFEHIYKSKLTKYKTWEGQIIQVKRGKHLSKSITIGNIYRPPKELLEYYNEFITEFSIILKPLGTNINEVIFTGDFNIDLLKMNNKQIISEYFDMLMGHRFYPKITLPTRLSNNHGTLIDNIFCKLSEITLDTTSGILTKKFSDHQPYFTILNNITVKDSPPAFVTTNKQYNESINKFYHDIATSDELQSLTDTLTVDPNINYNILECTK